MIKVIKWMRKIKDLDFELKIMIFLAIMITILSYIGLVYLDSKKFLMSAGSAFVSAMVVNYFMFWR